MRLIGFRVPIPEGYFRMLTAWLQAPTPIALYYEVEGPPTPIALYYQAEPAPTVPGPTFNS